MNKITRYDSAEYLETEEDIAAYLDAVVQESNDPTMLIHALGVVARARNFSQLARDTGISREGLYKALSDNGNPSFATIVKMVAAFGFHIKFVPSTHSKALKRKQRHI
jgi:probable addiction module antidote protein